MAPSYQSFDNCACELIGYSTTDGTWLVQIIDMEPPRDLGQWLDLQKEMLSALQPPRRSNYNIENMPLRLLVGWNLSNKNRCVTMKLYLGYVAL